MVLKLLSFMEIWKSQFTLGFHKNSTFLLKISKMDCLLLKKAMYGLVQAARQWWRKFISILVEEFKFKKSQAE
jgi:hypothetical protein